MIARTLVAILCAFLILLASTARAGGDTGGSSPDAQSVTPTVTSDEVGLSPADLLNPDGTLRLGEGVSGALNLSGWSVMLDPLRGPVLAPQSTGGGWLNLGEETGSPLDGVVYAIAVSGGDVYVGGDFSYIGGNPALSYIARWDGSAWQPLGNRLNNAVNAIAVSGSDVYVGGTFTDAGGNPNADRIARWSGSSWQPLGSELNSRVQAIAVIDCQMRQGKISTLSHPRNPS